MADEQENQTVEQTVEKSDYALIPPEGDPLVGRKAYWVLSQVLADKVRLGLHDRWFRNYQLRKGKHWKTAAPSGIPLVSANLIHTHVQRTVNTLTDNNPTFNVVALAGDVDDERKEAMLDLQRTTEYWWNEQEQQDVLETSVLNGETYGPAIEKVIFNPDLEYALGDVETVPVDPFRFGWYPCRLENARDLQKCEAVLHFYPMSVRQLRAKYPAKAARIKPDKEMLKELMDSDRREIGGQEQKGGFSLVEIGNTVKNLINFFSGGGGDDEEEETLVVEMWLRDKTRVVDGKRGDAPKYPGEIRYILACSGGVALEDKPNPNVNPNLPPDQARQTYLYDKYPFALANSVKDTSSAWGMCYDDKTEILTRNRGFVRFSALRRSDLVATRSVDGKFQWQKPIRYTNEQYDGEMYHFKSRSLDLVVTPNHRMLVGMSKFNKKTRAEKVLTAEEFARGLNHERRIPVTSIWDDCRDELKQVKFEKSAPPSKDIVMTGDDYCALLGAYLAEGNLHSVSGIEVAQEKTSKGFDAYKELFDRLGVKHDGKRWRLYGKTIKEHFEVLGHAQDKYIPTGIKDLPARQLKILWNYYVLGDGCYRKIENRSGRGSNYGHYTTHISTTSSRLADDLIEVGQKLGFSVSVSMHAPRGKGKSTQYTLCCRYSKYMSVHAERVQYDGRIYCVTVPNGIIYVRRDGKPCWSGNSDIEQMEWLLMEINKCLSQLVLEKDRSARKKLIIPRSAGVNPQEMVNYPSVIQPSNGQESQHIRWLETPPASVDYAATIEMFKSLFMLVGGTFDLDQAQVKGREVIAYKAIAALLERAATMSRGKIRAYSRLIRERGRMYLSHVMNFYTEDRWITYRDADGNDAVKQINGSKLVMPAKLSVVSGSTMPISQVQRREEAIELFKGQAIDQSELLERLNWPNRAEVVKRMQAGPLGMAMQNLEKAGTPEEFLQFLKTVSEADPKDLQKSIEKGEFPTFMQFLEKILAQAEGMQPQQDPAQAAEFQKVNAEVQKALAQAEKLAAEKELTVEKIMTEKIQQQVAMAGVQFDKEKLAMDRAKIVSDIENEAEGRYERGVDAAVKMAGSVQKNRPGYNERGLKSNNKEA